MTQEMKLYHELSRLMARYKAQPEDVMGDVPYTVYWLQLDSKVFNVTFTEVKE